MALAVSRRSGPRPAIVAAIAGAWAFALAAQGSGRADQLHHDWLIGGGLPIVAALLVFLLAWQVHVAAMMLPSSLPMLTLFDRASASQPSPGRVRAAFLAGYAIVWSAFGAAALIGDAMLHEAVHALPWLAQREWLIAGSVLVVAGSFQFSAVKDRCLDQCRHPGAFLLRHYERGVAGAYRLGKRHGLYCLGCCWALMLLMFAVGITNLLWMAPLTLVMVVEKRPAGRRLTSVVGVALIAAGALVLAHPPWLPAALIG